MVVTILFSLFLAHGETVSSDPIADIIKAEEEQLRVQERIDDSHAKQVKVVFDITRGVQKATIFVDGKAVSSHKISGAKNRKQTVKGERQCAFTTTGEGLVPSNLYRNYKSREHNVNLPHFVTFDGGRGIGAHQGPVGGFSSGCVRQTAAGAKAVYDTVMANSEVTKGSSKIHKTNVTFDVVDNTPGRYTAECACLENHMRDTSSARHNRVCELAKAEPKGKEEPVVAKKATKKKTNAVVAGDQTADTAPAAKPATAKKPTKKKKTLVDLIREGKAKGGLY